MFRVCCLIAIVYRYVVFVLFIVMRNTVIHPNDKENCFVSGMRILSDDLKQKGMKQAQGG